MAQRKEARTVATDPSLEKELACENQLSSPEAKRQEEALRNIERFTDQLAVMAHWFEQLQGEINDAHALLDPKRFDSLKRRVRLFCEAADSLCNMLGGRQ
jgi:hypothetical protein